MRETKGRADGGEVTRLVREQLGVRGIGWRRFLSSTNFVRANDSGVASAGEEPPAPQEAQRMSKLIRMDHTGHTTRRRVDERTTRRPSRRAVAAFRAELDRGYFAMVSTGEGHAEQVRELPVDAELVILRLPISGG